MSLRKKSAHRAGRPSKTQAKARAVSGRPAQSGTERNQHEKRLEALARELIDACMQGLKTFGLDEKRMAAILTAAAAGKSGRLARASEELTDADRLGHVVGKWGEDSAYRDSTGRPAVLSIRKVGRYSFPKLAHEFFGGWAVSDVIALGYKANVFEKVGTDKLALLNTSVLYPGNPDLLLAAAVRSVRRVFRAADVNRRLDPAIPEGWPDRAVSVEICEDDFDDFIAFMRPRIREWTEIANRWLVGRRAHPKKRTGRKRGKKKRRSGLQVFVYRE